MRKEFSLYLDLLRFFAASLVFLEHVNGYYPIRFILFNVGHEAVIFFFVLSGFVIAFVRDSKEHTLRDYAISRAGRIYSVALPALLLTICVDLIGRSVNLAIHGEPGAAYAASDQWVVRFLSSLAFTNELWFVSIHAFSNGPYWSLNYEVWYYISFACIAFAGPRLGWVLCGACLLIVGPKIAALAPIWWLGVWCYRTRLGERLSAIAAWILVVVSLAGIAAYFRLDIAELGTETLESWLGQEWLVKFTRSRNALGDYFLSFFIVFHFLGMRRVAPALGPLLVPLAGPIRWLASYTFSLYLFHAPLFYFYHAVLRAESGVITDFVVIPFITLASIFVLGTFTERRKHVAKRWVTLGLDLSMDVYRRIAQKWQRPTGT